MENRLTGRDKTISDPKRGFLMIQVVTQVCDVLRSGEGERVEAVKECSSGYVFWF